MRIVEEYGSKKRLFDLMVKVNKLNEDIIEKDDKNKIIDNFIKYVENHLQLTDNKPNIEISYEKDAAKEMKSFGKFTLNDNHILVIATNRNLADVLRTLAHEMVHFKQKLENRIKPDSNKDGSEIENEANAVAAVIMREFGKLEPNIFE